MRIFKIIYYVLSIMTLLYAAWFFITGVIGIIIKSKVKFPKSNKKNKFAILVAARNEELVINNLIESLKKQNYPKDKFEIYTIPNNCTDNTESVAKKAGSKIIDCNVKTRTKGDVLKVAFEKLKSHQDIDAYVVFDADNVVHPEFLNKMNDCLNAGYKVAEGFRDAKNPDDNWISGSYAIFYLVQNIFFNKARMSLGGSSSINGTGFMISKKLIDRDGFETYSLTEDVEFTGQCALKHEKIAFVEDAITYDEYPTSNKVSWIQRKRWSSGVMECMKLYSFKLFKNFLKTGNLSSLDMSLVYLGPMMQLLSTLLFLIQVIFRFMYIDINLLIEYFLDVDLDIIIYLLLAGMAVSVFSLIYKKKNVTDIWSGILLFPLFIFTWIPINICCLFKKETTWKAIKHDRNVDYNKMVKSSR